MDSTLDSLTWGDELSTHRRGKRSRMTWVRRVLVVLTALFVLGVLLSP
jgi:hypothetical protein